MKRGVGFVVYVLTFFLGSSESVAVFRFANIYGHHMVLQQAPKRATVWGFGEVGQKVTVTIGRELYCSGIQPGPNNTGIWSVLLRPHTHGGPHTIEATSFVNNGKVRDTLRDVLFGDVWICSGQSNMEMAVRVTDNGGPAILEAKNYKNIRLFTAEWSVSATPLLELDKIRQPWSVATPQSVGGKGFVINAHFSATCWFYGIHLYDKLKYPIGLVASSWGGSTIEHWSSRDALQKCTIKENIMSNDGWDKLKLVIYGDKKKPSRMWNAMMHPFTKMTIYGAIWYLGETNAMYGLNRYNCTFPALVDDWRAKWYKGSRGNTDRMFPFGFVQLSSMVKSDFYPKTNFPPLRWDQTLHYGYVPNDRQEKMFMAVAMDLGNLYSPYNSVHPTNKRDVGKRLALSGLAVAYGKKEYYTGPLVSEIKKRVRNGFNDLEVKFRSVDDKIEVRSYHGFEVLCQNCSVWITADITKIGPSSVVIRPSADCVVEGVRYAWSDFPCDMKECAIYSGDLPSPPFVKFGPFK